ncbi:MAG: DUF4160 domain-containing protein [Burkholderiaceae bacterium]|nr:DUF4160 domain-containing protein [Burkholderiaceae bacterium]
MHVHVLHPDGEAKFWLEPVIEMAQNFGLSARELKEAADLIGLHKQEIQDAWNKHFPS